VIGIAAAAILGGGAAGLTWTPVTISIAVVAGLILLMPLMYLLSFVRTPGTVFFSAYAMQFLGGRYEPLGVMLWPAPPMPPAPLPPIYQAPEVTQTPPLENPPEGVNPGL